MTTNADLLDVLPAALAYAKRGWPVFPLHSIIDGRCTCRKPKCNPGKHPRTEHGLKDATTNAATIEEYFVCSSNIGVVTGQQAGILVLDVDPRHGGDTELRNLIDRYDDLPETVEALTGGGGRHVFFKHPGYRFPCKHGFLPGLDLQGDGGYVVAAPSGHISGRRYEWHDGFAPDQVQLAPIPPWLLDILRKTKERPKPEADQGGGERVVMPYGAAALADEVAKVRAATEGIRNSVLNTSSFRLGQLVAAGELDEIQVLTELTAAARETGLGDTEIQATLKSGLCAGLQQPRQIEHRSRKVRKVNRAIAASSADSALSDRPTITNCIASAVGDDIFTTAVPISTIAEKIFTTTDGWPCRVGGTLFVPDGPGVRFIHDADDLFAFLHAAASVSWRGGQDSAGTSCVTRKEIMAHLEAASKQYDAVSAYPFEPMPRNLFTCWTPPSGYRPTGEFLDRLLDRFSPSTRIDRSLIRAMVLTMLWGGPPGERPLFVVTGDNQCGQEGGKTRLALLTARLVGGAFSPKLTGRNLGDDLPKQLVSEAAQERRVLLLDNQTGITRDDTLADLVTGPVIDGRAAFGRQTRRPNHLTWVVTSNDANLSTDLASRSVLIRLARPDRDSAPSWENETATFVDEHRDEIIADGLEALRGIRYPIKGRRTRFPQWCDQVLALDPDVDTILPRIARGATISDADLDDVEFLLREIEERYTAGTLRAFYYEGGHRLPPKLLAEAWHQSTGERLSTGWVIRRLKGAFKRGKLHDLTPIGQRNGGDWLWKPLRGMRTISEDSDATDDWEGSPSPEPNSSDSSTWESNSSHG